MSLKIVTDWQSPMSVRSEFQLDGAATESSVMMLKVMCAPDKFVVVRVFRTYSTTGMTATSFVTRYDKLDEKEIKDLLLCFLYIVRNLAEGV